MLKLVRQEAWSMTLGKFICQQVTAFRKQQTIIVYGHIKENHKGNLADVKSYASVLLNIYFIPKLVCCVGHQLSIDKLWFIKMQHNKNPATAGFSYYISSLFDGNNSPRTDITTVNTTPKIDAFTKSNVPPCIETST
jgi:hypothetical protein